MAGRLGKKIDTWEVRTDAGKFQILCYMGRGRHDGIHFTAICEGVSPRYQRTMDNVQDLERDAKKEVRQRSAITWSPMILVETGARRKQCQGRTDLPDGVIWSELQADADPDDTKAPVARVLAELCIDWQIIEVATRPDGKQLYRYVSRDSGWGKQTLDGLPKTCEFENIDTQPWLEEPKKSVTLLPYTADNVAALTMLCNKLGGMAMEVARLLGPANAVQTLLQVQQSGVARLGFAGESYVGKTDGLPQDSVSESVGSAPGDKGRDQQADGDVGDHGHARPGRNRAGSRRKSSAK